MLANRGIQVKSTDYSLNPDHDATSQKYWDAWKSFDIGWTITNPLFNLASQIVPKAYAASSVGVAFLLRLSYLEPCVDRGNWLAQHPPNKLIIMPRISFTGDGKTDSATTAWFVWIKGETSQKIVVVPKG